MLKKRAYLPFVSILSELPGVRPARRRGIDNNPKLCKAKNHPPPAMQSFSYHAATARIHRLDGGVSEVVYSGPMGCDSFHHLRRLALDATADTACLVVRLERVLSTMCCTPPVEGANYSENTAPAAVIVREDQFDMWDDYARQAARQGVMRAVFLESFAAQAYQWARASAGAACPAGRR